MGFGKAKAIGKLGGELGKAMGKLKKLVVTQ